MSDQQAHATPDKHSVEKAWTSGWEEIARELDVTPEQGLSSREASARLQQYGENRLQEIKRRSPWQILLDQFKSLIVALLGAAAIISFALTEHAEGIAILVVIVINALIGFFTELKAVRSMEALRKLGSVNAKARRDGQVQQVPASSLVPGDIVILEAGDMIAADLRIITASRLQCDESALTGESVPVDKEAEPLPPDTVLSDRANMLYKGTALTRGSGEALVVATGMGTELGHISSLVSEAEEGITPLEKRLHQLGRNLIWVTLGIAAVIVVVGLLQKKDWRLMIETGIALAVATIPEGLPIVATIALARGVWRMAKQNALINRLSSVETLGATTLICTDKTGTLTENRMTVIQLRFASGQVHVHRKSGEAEAVFTRDDQPVSMDEDQTLADTMRVAVLCNNAALHTDEPLDRDHAVGDPMEVALLIAAIEGGVDKEQLLQRMPEEREEAFESETKMMATFNGKDGGWLVAVKGAPEPVLNACTRIATPDGLQPLTDQMRKKWLQDNVKMADDGLRVLAFARKEVDNLEAPAYEELTFLGLMGLLDPPRPDVHHALAACQKAGIRVVMITGDQPVTGRNIALAVGLADSEDVGVINGADLKPPPELDEQERKELLDAQVFARVSPQQKLDLIALHQRNGAIVAMTGDGVNDAPALKKADIGVAMGLRGTQVAREAADMVLKDDQFSTIVAAVEQGRVIFNNIRRVVFFLLSCNVSEVLVIGLATLINLKELPIRPLQILFLNLVTDVFPALALGVGEGDPELMTYPPRDAKQPILTRGHWTLIGIYGFVMTVAVLGAFMLASHYGFSMKQTVTISFLTLAFTQLWHVFNLRDPKSSIFHNDIVGNLWIWGALGLCTLLLVAAVYLPPLAAILEVEDPGLSGWELLLGMSLIPLIFGQVLKLFGK